jgi:hypothetical protein
MKKIICIAYFFSHCIGNSIAQLPNNISAADKVYGLSKFWQEVNYNFYLSRTNR